MTITTQHNNYDKRWNNVIYDAESEIAAMKNRILALKASIRLFRKKMEDGEDLPEDLSKYTVTQKAGTAG